MAVDNLRKNYFELFDLPQIYVINEEALAKRYRSRLSAVHPDRFANDTAQVKRLSMQQAAFTNEAFETLKSPLKRAEYLLQLHGFAANNHSVHDTEFLMEQMVLRETLSETVNHVDPYEQIDRMTDQVLDKKSALIDDIQQAFELSPPALSAIHGMTQKLQFFEKLIDEIRQIEADLEDAT